MRGYVDGRSKLAHRPVNPSTNTRKIVKWCVNVCGYGYGCVNANVVDFASANDNVIGCVDVYEKNFFASIDKTK